MRSSSTTSRDATIGFDSDHNEVTIVDGLGEHHGSERRPRSEVAAAILDRVQDLRVDARADADTMEAGEAER